MDTTIFQTQVMTSDNVLIPIDLIDPNPYQPRETMDPDEVAKLAADIKRDGLMQIPSARQVGDRYQLAFGHRRLAAFQLNGETHMPLIIRDLTDLQMFERGVSENMQRQDLNKIEEARAMQRYMDDFGKTSVEAAEFFGCSPEKIRASTRLLDLQPAAQAALAEGAINIETARNLLSMQRIAPASKIEETLERLKAGVDRFNDRTTPIEILEESINGLDESVRMWNDANRDGKPRSQMDYREEGWLLSMKNFPNKKLPHLTSVDLAIALGVQDDETVLNLLQQSFAGWSASTDWDDLIYPDMKRRLADYPDLLAKVDHLINPPACSACPFYTRLDGLHYCGMKTCHTRKTSAWKRDILDHASRDLGILIYEKKDGKYKILEGYGDGEKLFEKRHKDLRLISREGIGGYHYQHLKGVKDWAFLVVLTGDALQQQKAEAQDERAKEKAAQTIDQLRRELIDRNRKQLEWEASLTIKTLFDALNVAAIDTWEDLITMWKIRPNDVPQGCTPADDAPEAERAEFKRRTWAIAMIHEARTYEDHFPKNMESFAERLVEIVKPWGIKLPKAIIRSAKRMDEQIALAIAEAKQATKKKGKK